MPLRRPVRALALALATLAPACAHPAAQPPHPAMSPAPAPAPTPDPAPAAPAPPVPEGVSERAMRVYRDAFVVDMHDDMPTRMVDEGYDADVRHPPGFGRGEGQTDYPRLRESGLTAEFLSAWVDASYARKRPDRSYERALQLMDTIHAFVARHPDGLLFATTAADVRRAKREGKVAILIGVEGGHAIESSLEKLRELYRRGARYMTLTWNNGNAWAGSSIGSHRTRRGGLTPFGREVVREMNRLGMLVDVSHVSDRTFRDVIETTTAPVIASHSSARALDGHPRNLTDDQLRAVARTGGVVNVNFYSTFIDPSYAAAVESVDYRMRALRASLVREHHGDTRAVRAEVARRRAAELAAVPRTPLSVLIDHIDHVARVAGIDHVGLGSDFDGVSALPEGMDDVTDLPRIAQALLDRGYSEADVQKVLGGNMMRVMAQVLK